MALSALVVFVSACSKEKDLGSHVAGKKATVSLPSDPRIVLEAVNSFPDNIHDILVDGDPYDGVSDEYLYNGI